MIQVGDELPEGTLTTMRDGEVETIDTTKWFAGKKTVLFGIPGAFTPTCTAKHMPGFVDHLKDFEEKGVDRVCCFSVNDAFVLNAWARALEVPERLILLADGNADYAKALGLDFDASEYGMGTRSKRFAMVVDDLIVTLLNVEENGDFRVSSAEVVLEALD